MQSSLLRLCGLSADKVARLTAKPKLAAKKGTLTRVQRGLPPVEWVSPTIAYEIKS